MQDTQPSSHANGLDAVIKVLTIFKLLLQVAFYGLLLGGVIWFLLNNPLPEIMRGLQEQLVGSFLGAGL